MRPPEITNLEYKDGRHGNFVISFRNTKRDKKVTFERLLPLVSNKEHAVHGIRSLVFTFVTKQ